jgi:O-antigen ligase
MTPVIAGTYLMSCLPVSYYVISALKGKKRLFALLGTAIIIAGLIFTFTRMSWLGALIAAILYALRKNIKLFQILIIACFICAGLAMTIKARPVLADSIKYKKIIKYFKEYRLKRYPVTFRMFKDHPIAGVGLNNYRIVFDDYYGSKSEQYAYKIPDNMYLMIIGESGILGFGLFILFIFVMLKKAVRDLRNDKDSSYKDVRLVFILMLTGILIHMASYELFYWATPYFLFLFSIAGLSVSEVHEKLSAAA